MMRSIAPPRPTSSRIWLASPDDTSRRSAGSWSSEGGSRRTAADVTRRPYSLSVRTSGQVTGSLPRTIQALPAVGLRPPGGTGTTMASSGCSRLWVSATPTTSKVCSEPLTLTVSRPLEGSPREMP